MTHKVIEEVQMEHCDFHYRRTNWPNVHPNMHIDLSQHVCLTWMSLWTLTGPQEIMVAVWVFLVNNLHLCCMQFHLLNNISFLFLSSLLHWFFFLLLILGQDLCISCGSVIFHLVFWMISANHQTGSHIGAERSLTNGERSVFHHSGTFLNWFEETWILFFFCISSFLKFSYMESF